MKSERKTFCAFTRFKSLVKTTCNDPRFSQKGLVALQGHVESLVMKVLSLVTTVMGDKRKTITKEDIETVCRVLSAGRYELVLPAPGVKVPLPRTMGHHMVAKLDGYKDHKWRMSKTATDGVAGLYVACIRKLTHIVVDRIDDATKKINPDAVKDACENSGLVF